MRVKVGEGFVEIPRTVEAHGAAAIDEYVKNHGKDLLAGIPFASASAKKLASKAGLTAHNFAVPKGKTVSADDVRKMVPGLEDDGDGEKKKGKGDETPGDKSDGEAAAE